MIRRAQAQDLDDVAEVLAEAAVWLGSQGLDQWQYPVRREQVAESISRGECYIATSGQNGRGSEVLATITVDDHADPEFWSPEDGPDEALYVHRLAVRRSAAGRELGAYLLDWAGGHAYAAGKKWLRLDAWRSNPGLLDYYAQRGWQHVRTVELGHRKSGALFQRRAVADGSDC